MKPRIAIPVPTTADAGYNQRSWPQYAEAVRQAGGEALEIPLSASERELRELMVGCQGFLLPGSPADVDPARYGAERHEATAPRDAAREAVDFALLDEAAKTGKPVLGICYGCQSLNVWRGGTLVQDISPVPVNHGAGAQVAVAHSSWVLKDSVLGGLVAADEASTEEEYFRLPMNSSHHQAVGIAGDGLRVVARSVEDGVVEAIERHTKMFHVEHSGMLVGVQWHPERSIEISATSRALFARLIEEAQRWRR